MGQKKNTEGRNDVGLEEAEPPQELTPAEKITLEYIAPSDALQPFVTTFYYFCCDERDIRDFQPAAVGSLIFFLRGEGHMHFDDRSDPSHLVSLLAPLSRAAPFEVDGPFHTLGASLSPLGWAALTGLNAKEASDRLTDAGSIFGEDILRLGKSFQEDYLASAATPGQLCARLENFIAERLRPVEPKHIEFIRSVTAWMSADLNPDIADLQELTGYSSRQTQRLVERYFGCTPKVLVRKYRALRIVALLNDPSTSNEQVAELLNFFYDQSHLIREVRTFAGRTPARFGDSEAPILEHLLSVKNFREIKPNVAPIPGD